MLAWEELALACIGALVVVACIEASLLVGKPVSLVVGVLVGTWGVSSVGMEVCIEASVVEVVVSVVVVVAYIEAFLEEVAFSEGVERIAAEVLDLQGLQLNQAEPAEEVEQEWDHFVETGMEDCIVFEEELEVLHIHQLLVLGELHKTPLQLVQVLEEPVVYHSLQELQQLQLLAHVHVNGHENVHHHRGLGQKLE